jgi:hypothetical protein
MEAEHLKEKWGLGILKETWELDVFERNVEAGHFEKEMADNEWYGKRDDFGIRCYGVVSILGKGK